MAAEAYSVSRAIRLARSERGLTQGELASRIRVSQSTISFWENGTEIPIIEHIIVLALELPLLIESFEARERELLCRVLKLQRELFAGRYACVGCQCQKGDG